MNSLAFLKNHKISGKMVPKGLVRLSQGKRQGRAFQAEKTVCGKTLEKEGIRHT